MTATYTVAGAAKLVGMPVSSMRSWLVDSTDRSYTPRRKGPVIVREGDPSEVSFLDLVECLFVRALRNKGLKMATIRAAARTAADFMDSHHPFALRRFETDGHRIFGVAHGDNQVALDLVSGQTAFKRVIEPYFKTLDYEGDLAARWWPLGRRRLAVVDPRVAYGAPSVIGVPTSILSKAYNAERADGLAAKDAARKVAKWFEVPPRAVKSAIEMERKIAGTN